MIKENGFKKLREGNIRVWDSSLQQMYYKRINQLSQEELLDKDRYKIMFSSGLKDITGKEIYEDDIVEYTREGWDSDYKLKTFHQVIFIGGAFCLLFKDQHDKIIPLFLSQYNISSKVVGHIYEASESLLEIAVLDRSCIGSKK